MSSESPKPPQRIVLVSESRLLREALKRAIGKFPGLQVVDEVSNEDEIPGVFEQTQIDWLVISTSPGGDIPSNLEKLIATRFPTVRILGISVDGSLVIVKWLAFRERRLSGLSLEGLTGLILRGPGAKVREEQKRR